MWPRALFWLIGRALLLMNCQKESAAFLLRWHFESVIAFLLLSAFNEWMVTQLPAEAIRFHLGDAFQQEYYYCSLGRGWNLCF